MKLTVNIISALFFIAALAIAVPMTIGFIWPFPFGIEMREFKMEGAILALMSIAVKSVFTGKEPAK